MNGKARQIVAKDLHPGEEVVGLIEVNDGSAGGNVARSPSVERYRQQHQLVEGTVRGVPVFGNSWLTLTPLRLVIHRGAVVTFRPKPKELLVALPADEIAGLVWWETKLHGRCRALHLDLGAGDHLVRFAGIDEDCNGFIAALGAKATEIAEP